MDQIETQIGVVGAGLIGLSWAGLFSAFGYETIVYDPYLKKKKITSSSNRRSMEFVGFIIWKSNQQERRKIFK